MERFLQYSLKHGRTIRAMMLWNGSLIQKPITVLAIQDGAIMLRMGTRKNPLEIPIADILSCDYARGDRGEG